MRPRRSSLAPAKAHATSRGLERLSHSPLDTLEHSGPRRAACKGLRRRPGGCLQSSTSRFAGSRGRTMRIQHRTSIWTRSLDNRWRRRVLADAFAASRHRSAQPVEGVGGEEAQEEAPRTKPEQVRRSGSPQAHARSYFCDVKCPGCFNITTVFSHAQTVVLCGSCATVLCQPTGCVRTAAGIL